MLDFVSKGRITSPVEITFQSVGDYPYHWHDCLEIIFVLKGTIQIFAGTDNIILNTGDIEIINFNEIHRIVGKIGNIVLSLKIQAEFAQEIISDIKDIVFNSMVVSYHEKKRDAIGILGKMILILIPSLRFWNPIFYQINCRMNMIFPKKQVELHSFFLNPM